ncbi:hypothetical protein E2C01_101915 [Portunus trituberculatus]|uniref:Uncharacterized protein n=1 Tax=Portunus trituberculatus TaxID=210409 RepID=A0A5B7KN12_PORTR|nr:hypothetical protein [Portunus trituberculatus]
MRVEEGEARPMKVKGRHFSWKMYVVVKVITGKGPAPCVSPTSYSPSSATPTSPSHPTTRPTTHNTHDLFSSNFVLRSRLLLPRVPCLPQCYVILDLNPSILQRVFIFILLII